MIPTLIAVLIGAGFGTYAGAKLIAWRAHVTLRWATLVLFWLLLITILVSALAPQLFPTHRIVSYVDTHAAVMLGFYCIFGGGIALIMKKRSFFFFRPHPASTPKQ